jgi:hypothetical protein
VVTNIDPNSFQNLRIKLPLFHNAVLADKLLTERERAPEMIALRIAKRTIAFYWMTQCAPSSPVFPRVYSLCLETGLSLLNDY